ncbi:MAG: hypothetical protein BJ554DRAFT_4479, partial [Olpidium bornovanus]
KTGLEGTAVDPGQAPLLSLASGLFLYFETTGAGYWWPAGGLALAPVASPLKTVSVVALGSS